MYVILAIVYKYSVYGSILVPMDINTYSMKAIRIATQQQCTLVY